MNGLVRRLAAVAVLAATMVSLASPAFTACSCAPCRAPERVASARGPASHACPGCHGAAPAAAGTRMSAACCTSRALVDAPAVSPAPVQVDKPAPFAHVAILPVALADFAFGDAAPARPFVDVSPHAPPSPHLSSLLRL